MDGATPIDRDTRLAEYREAGWSRFDEHGAPYRPGPLQLVGIKLLPRWHRRRGQNRLRTGSFLRLGINLKNRLMRLIFAAAS